MTCWSSCWAACRYPTLSSWQLPTQRRTCPRAPSGCTTRPTAAPQRAGPPRSSRWSGCCQDWTTRASLRRSLRCQTPRHAALSPPRVRRLRPRKLLAAAAAGAHREARCMRWSSVRCSGRRLRSSASMPAASHQLRATAAAGVGQERRVEQPLRRSWGTGWQRRCLM